MISTRSCKRSTVRKFIFHVHVALFTSVDTSVSDVLPLTLGTQNIFYLHLRGFAGTIPQSSILVTFNVESLNINIPHGEGTNYRSITLHRYHDHDNTIPLSLFTDDAT